MSAFFEWFDRIKHNAVGGMHQPPVAEPAYRFSPEEKPTFPGSPHAPLHPAWRRVGYACVAVLVGITATVGNAFVTVNIGNLSGALGVYTAQASLLVPIYVAMNACANLLLIKARAQFGIPAVTHGLLIAYALAALLQFVFPGFVSAVLIRAVNGMAAAALTTLTIYNLLQVFPVKLRPMALVFGISIPQLGTPLARLLPIELLALDNWQGLHMMELGLALAALAAISALPLPPGERSKAFEPLDFLTITLFTTSIMLVCCVLGVGRVVWWTDTPWLGWALAAAVPLFATGLLIEHYRKSPLLQIGWIGSSEILRFALVALVVRIALAEQTYGAVGLLTSGGLTNDQLHILFSLVIVGMVLGMVASALTLSATRLPYQVMFAALIIALGAWLDSNATNVTRPMQLYWSQSLIAFGTTLFIGPALLYGYIKMIAKGPNYLVSFIVLFSMTQNIGGLAGSALLGSYQVERTRFYTAVLSEQLVADDPQVVNRLQAGAGAIAGAVADPALRNAQGAGLLGQSMSREANVLAYNDVFRLVAMLALAAAIFVLYRLAILHYRDKHKVIAEAAT